MVQEPFKAIFYECLVWPLIRKQVDKKEANENWKN